MSKKYITRLTMSKCSFGSEERQLMINPDHGVIYHSPDTPLLNANDHIPNINIFPYGTCKKTGGTCVPKTEPKAWENVNKKHILDGAPALMEDSVLPCEEGGTISIIIDSEDVSTDTTKTEDQADSVESGVSAATEAENNHVEDNSNSFYSSSNMQINDK